MNTATVLEALETEERPETYCIGQWNAPVTGGLAEAKIAGAPFAMFCTPRIEVKGSATYRRREGVAGVSV